MGSLSSIPLSAIRQALVAPTLGSVFSNLDTLASPVLVPLCGRVDD